MDDAMMGGKGMSPRKAMAADGGGSFGCGSIHETSQPHPERDSGLHKKTLKDHERGAGRPVAHSRGKAPAQSNPDHGRHDGAHGVDFGAKAFPR